MTVLQNLVLRKSVWRINVLYSSCSNNNLPQSAIPTASQTLLVTGYLPKIENKICSASK